MAGRPLASRRPFDGVWRAFRNGDEASGTLVNFVLGTAAFLVSSVVLLHFVAEPPGATTGLEQQLLQSQAQNAMSVLMGTAGHPSAWHTDATTVDGLTRLGLLEPGTSSRVNASKFDLLARGSYLNPSTTNGLVDYAEARRALGLEGHNFHLRAYPLIEPFAGNTYGIEGMQTFRVAYLSHWNGGLESPASMSERVALDALDISFTNTLQTSLTNGDVFRDFSQDIKKHLVPRLGATPDQTVINNGQGAVKHDFMIVEATEYRDYLWQDPLGTRALALKDPDGGSLGYTRGRELRVELGVANMSGRSYANFTWKEYVDTDFNATGSDAGDYGFLEVSADGGQTWIEIGNTALYRSQELLPGTWTPRILPINPTTCAACANVQELRVAMHWIADGDTTTGAGWFLDDVKLDPVENTGFSRDFEKPVYDMLIIGSDVSQTALTPAEVKNAIRDYVYNFGGRLIVLGGQTNTNWLQPLFNVGTRDAQPGVATPDVTHPLLTVPNSLDWRSYDHNGKAWKFNGASDAELFNMVVGTSGNEHILGLSARGSFGHEREGLVMLTTYLPYKTTDEQEKRFFANAITYGRYHRLYIEVGPPVPENVPVVAVTRGAIMDKTMVDARDYIEMAFVIYLWEGDHGDPSASNGPLIPAGPPKITEAVPGDGLVTLRWQTPSAPGTGQITGYNIYRGSTNGTERLLAQTGINATLEWLDRNVTNGQAYWYNVTAIGTAGESSSSNHVSAVPSTTASAPQGVTAVGLVSAIQVTWAAPASNGGSAVTNYRIYRGPVGGPWSFHAEIGSNTSYLDSNLGLGVTYSYKVSAVNAAGEGAQSGDVWATTASLPSAPLALAAAPGSGNGKIALSWQAPLDMGGGTFLHYRVYRGTSAGTIVTDVGTSTSLSFTDSGLTPLTTYYYQVACVTTAGEGPRSNTAFSLPS